MDEVSFGKSHARPLPFYAENILIPSSSYLHFTYLQTLKPSNVGKPVHVPVDTQILAIKIQDPLETSWRIEYLVAPSNVVRCATKGVSLLEISKVHIKGHVFGITSHM